MKRRQTSGCHKADRIGVTFFHAITAQDPSDKNPARGYLDGQMLIAMPAMNDERFARSVIYVCAHSSEGAMGIIVNQPVANINFPDLLVKLEVIPAADRIQAAAAAPAP